LVVKAVDGQDWEIETAPLNFFRQSKAPLDLYKVGSSVKVAGWPSKRSNVRMYGTNILSSDDRELVLWRGRSRWQADAFVASRPSPSAAATAAAAKTLFQVWGSIYPAGQLVDDDASPVALRRVPMPFTEAGRRAVASVPIDDAPALGCKPKGMWIIMSAPTPMEIVDEGEEIIVRIEEFDSVRTIHMDGGEDPAAQLRTPLGYSVGRWEGDTLVVETTRPAAMISSAPDARLVEIHLAPADCITRF
jgi:hypothetical protein